MEQEQNNKIPDQVRDDNGKKPLYKKWWFWVGLVLVIIMLVVGYIAVAEKKDRDIEAEKQQKKEEAGGNEFEWPSKTAKYITAVPVDLTQIETISKFRSCAGHVRSGYNFDQVLENDSSMKHYLFPVTAYQNTNDKIKLFAPFDGNVTEVILQDTGIAGKRPNNGNGIFLSSPVDPNAQFGFGHMYFVKDFKAGDKVKAGELLGYAATDCQKGGTGCDFDIDLDTPGGSHAYKDHEVLDSIFNHMNDFVLAEFAKYGATPENMIIAKEYRDANPCNYQGENKSYSTVGNRPGENYIILQHQ